MDNNQIDLVQGSFAKVVPIAQQAGEMFYARLFEIAPDVRPMFKGDISEQAGKLMSTLRVVVNGLSDLDTVVPAAQKLALAHVEFGVKPEHYGFVGSALIDTLEKGLGDAFSDDTRAAWVNAYDTLSGVMIATAYPEGEAVA